MSAAPEPAAPRPSGARRFLLVWLAVSAVTVLSHFVFAPRMGLYEDDHWRIGVPMCDWRGAGDLLKAVKAVFGSYFQGRPLQYGVGFALAYAGTHAGGLVGAYVLAAAVWIVNAGLCLALLWRRCGPLAATVAALVFVLLPADTTQPMLHTAFFVQPSVTFLLLSGIAYARGRSVLAVACAAGTLITYESCFLPALVWPVLFSDSARPLWRRALVHGLAMGAVLALALFVRVQVGESRVAGAMTDKHAAVEKVWQLATVGPKTSLETFVTRPMWTARTWRTATRFNPPGPGRLVTGSPALVVGFVALVALVLARRVGRPTDALPARSVAEGAAVPAPAGGAPPAPETNAAGTVVRLLVAGAAMVVLSYVASLTRPPQIVDGRMSSVHTASAVGWGVFFGGLAAGAAALLARARAGWVVAPLLAGYFGLLAGFHVFVQREYLRAWLAQGEFWRDVVVACPDVGPGTVILYPLAPPASEMVHNQEWADHMVFAHLFAVPADWPAAPRAFAVGHTSWGYAVAPDYKGYDWNEVERDGDRLYWKHWDGTRVLLEPGNVILLRRAPGGRYERVTGTVRMAGIDLPLREPGGAAFAFPPHALYSAMFAKGIHHETHRRVSR